MAYQKAVFTIDWSSRSRMRGPGAASLGDLVQKLQERLAPDAMGISISYVDDRIMRKLNREHRGINRTTDVLSFPSETEKGAFPHLGDIVISLPVAEKLAKRLRTSRRRVVETLVIHGFLHLSGYDHEKDEGEMMDLQARLERECLEAEPLSLLRKRGRKSGSKVKKLKDGTRVVVTGRAAKAITRQEDAEKLAPRPRKPVARTLPARPPRSPGRPRKIPIEVAAPVRRTRRRRAPKPKSGVIA